LLAKFISVCRLVAHASTDVAPVVADDAAASSPKPALVSEFEAVAAASALVSLSHGPAKLRKLPVRGANAHR
jgi:hypothetical protein